MNDDISTRKIPSENTRRSRVFFGIFLVEMASFMFLSQDRDTKAIFYLLYKIRRHSCLCTVIQNENDVNRVSIYNPREDEAHPIRACVGRVLFYKQT